MYKLVFICAVFVFSYCGYAKTIMVAVASNFKTPLESLINEYKKTNNINFSIISASTGKIYAQVNNGARYDLIFTADEKTLDMLEANGVTDRNYSFVYGTGRIVLISKITEQSPLDFYLSGKYKNIVIAKPETAPYGQAALEFLGNRKSLIFADNVTQALHLFRAGGADLAIVAYSQALELENKFNMYLIPNDEHRPIKQKVSLVKKSKNIKEAIRFLNYIKSENAKNILKNYGYE